MSGRLTVDGYSSSKDGTLPATISDAVHPYEVFTLPGSKLTQLSHLNDTWPAQFKLSAGEYVSFKSKDGTIIHGYLYKPVDHVPGKKYPAIHRPHGGPTEEYEADFEEPAQLFAAKGYVVLYPNPRGSSGYGEEFCKAIFADWGNKDY